MPSFLAALAALFWFRWRFSLRTMLIATTLIAALLGLIVYLARHQPKPEWEVLKGRQSLGIRDKICGIGKDAPPTGKQTSGNKMRFRKLRIAWSVVWGIACVLLIVLWVRSYWWGEQLSYTTAQTNLFRHLFGWRTGARLLR